MYVCHGRLIAEVGHGQCNCFELQAAEVWLQSRPGRYHSQWRKENPCPISEAKFRPLPGSNPG